MHDFESLFLPFWINLFDKQNILSNIINNFVDPVAAIVIVSLKHYMHLQLYKAYVYIYMHISKLLHMYCVDVHLLK